MTTDRPFVPRPEVVELLVDCLHHPDTELLDDEANWKHEDSRPVTDAEIAVIRKSRLGEMRAALDVCMAMAEASYNVFRDLEK